MNYKFQKRPIIIEAFQMTKTRRWDNQDWPNWLNMAWNEDIGVGMWCDEDPNDNERLYLGTLEGVYVIQWDDWIIQGIQGELYPCKPDIFDATYVSIHGEQDSQ